MSVRRLALVAIAATPLVLGGCLAKTAFDVATAPVRVAGRAVDMATTSQSEADEARGREIRRREERLGRLQRQMCIRDSREAVAVRREIDALLPAIPVEPERDD